MSMKKATQTVLPYADQIVKDAVGVVRGGTSDIVNTVVTRMNDEMAKLGLPAGFGSDYPKIRAFITALVMKQMADKLMGEISQP